MPSTDRASGSAPRSSSRAALLRRPARQRTVQAGNAVCARLHQRLFAHGAAELPGSGIAAVSGTGAPRWPLQRAARLHGACLTCKEVGSLFGAHFVYDKMVARSVCRSTVSAALQLLQVLLIRQKQPVRR